MVESVRLILKNKGSQVWSLAPDATVYEAIVLMSKKNVGALLVVSEGKLVGIISERDYARKVILQGKSSIETLVGEIMTTSVIAVTPGHTVDECMQIMTSNHIRHLPVLEGEKLVGAISIGDLVKAIISTQAETIQQMGNYITGKYPA
ncbi:MAG: CBS domain-containing protein [Acidobacteria bacterium]|nr:CBS domain-containing protein [Acidobacteriota bacterium]